MPIYTYQCTNEYCATTTEVMRSVENRPDTIECSECGSVAERTITNTGAPQFKGHGFHSTDYR